MLDVCVQVTPEMVQPQDAGIPQQEEVNQVNFSSMLHYITLLYHHIFIQFTEFQ
jgi:hypothetical protein